MEPKQRSSQRSFREIAISEEDKSRYFGIGDYTEIRLVPLGLSQLTSLISVGVAALSPQIHRIDMSYWAVIGETIQES